MKVQKQPRWQFIRTSSLGLGAALMPVNARSFLSRGRNITHIVSLSFDDGFEKSSIKTAKIYEKYKMSACINVIASAHEIMPHSLKHTNLKESPLAEAQELVLQCLDIFEKKLDAFDALRKRCQR